MVEKFAVGDRVKTNAQYQKITGTVFGETGTIIKINQSSRSFPIEVQADTLIDGVDLALFYEDELDLLSEDYPVEVPC